MKKVFTSQQKSVVALEAIKGIKTMSEIASLHAVHPIQIQRWKKVLQDNAAQLFSDKRTSEGKTQEQLTAELYRIIGQRDTELEWLKKKLLLES
jgi:putative transposase